MGTIEVAKGWLSNFCSWEAAVHTLDKSYMDVKLMMMMIDGESPIWVFYYSNDYPFFLSRDYYNNSSGICVVCIYDV